MVLTHDLCSHLQNGFRARLRQLSIPHTTQNLAIATIMLRNGLLSNVTRGTIRDADPQEWANVPEQHRRIWLDLKYRDNLPVLSKAEVISKPSHKINVDSSQLRRICSGRPANFIKPLGLGEIAVVQTKDKDHEYLEAREALQRGLGGMMLCRMR